MNKTKDVIGDIEKMYDLYAKPIFYYLLTILKKKEDAEDVLHNLFLKISRLYENIKMEDVKGYLFVSARNEAMSFIQKNKRDVEKEDIDLKMLESTNKELLPSDEVEELEKALLMLPLEQREVVFMKEYQGFTFKEIASILNISENTANSRYRYALVKLKKSLTRGSHG
ncbi:MAG: sigma-70 family RNA polymerase sigma factor [Candidatus Firestonebacteria bacterium]|nr:sigma-70 family RNA polymerase sigma factor [Candidatus Firestonebacteria bacterium]